MTNFIPAEYFVLYFDLLGVRAKLFKDIDVHCPVVSPSKQEEINLTSLAISRFLSAMRHLHQKFENPEEFVEEIFRKYPSVDKIALTKTYYDQASKLVTGVQQGSDTTMLYVKNNCEMATIVVLYWLQIFPIEYFKAMSDGVLIRGSVSLGTAWEVERGSLFGPVIKEASDYEGYAQFPRIVATNNFMEHWKNAAQKMNRAGNCDGCADILSLFEKENEMWVLNCFSRENCPVDAEMLCKAKSFVCDAYQSFGTYDGDVALKYSYLCSKFNEFDKMPYAKA